MLKEISFSIDVPDNISDSDLEEFVEFEIGICGGISLENPLCDGTDLSTFNPSNLSIS